MVEIERPGLRAGTNDRAAGTASATKAPDSAVTANATAATNAAIATGCANAATAAVCANAATAAGCANAANTAGPTGPTVTTGPNVVALGASGNGDENRENYRPMRNISHSLPLLSVIPPTTNCDALNIVGAFGASNGILMVRVALQGLGPQRRSDVLLQS